MRLILKIGLGLAAITLLPGIAGMLTLSPTERASLRADASALAEAKSKLQREIEVSRATIAAAESAERMARAAASKDISLAEASCQLTAEKAAKDPASIEWLRDERSFSYASGSTTRAMSKQPMRAKNGFGALTLSVVWCDLIKSGENWTVSTWGTLP